MNAFESVKVYKSLLRIIDRFDARSKPHDIALAVEYRLILIPHDTDHNEPKTTDLQLMFAIKEGLIINWPLQVLLTMLSVASSSRSLGYPIFIYRRIDHLLIDTSEVKSTRMNPTDHILIGHEILQLGICHFYDIWEYREDINFPIICTESTDDDTNDEGDELMDKISQEF
ncbi:hypothetical protein Lal_00033610 [Lupinus albus]|nr:hypothetical protein Lal_00033610 [Lupinus albus]